MRLLSEAHPAMATMRILDDSSRLGQQTLLVDAQGNGDTTSIQTALNQAAGYATPTSRWSVRVAPGLYDEQLILKDNVDLLGLGPGRATRLQRTSGAVITAPANCCVANLWLESSDAPVISLPAEFSGTLELEGVLIDQSALDVSSISLGGGTLVARHCSLAAGGALVVNGGSLELLYCQVRNQAGEDGGGNIALYIQHGSLRLLGCLVENVSPAGYAVYIDNTTTRLRAFHSTFRKASATYALHATLSTLFPLACCAGNGPLHPNLSGYQDYAWDAGL